MHGHAIEPFPRGPLLAAGVLIAATIAVAAWSRHTGDGRVALPPVETIASIDVAFADRADGGVEVTAAADGRVLHVYEPGTNGFVRGVMRGLARERRLAGIGAGPPFRLALGADGRLTLSDTATGRVISLEAFGPDNVGAFAEILNHREVRQ
jgi:putative photosynthetic complex assembly protein